MPEAIADACPLIYLSALDRFSLLREAFDRVLVPEAVWEEVVDQGEGEPGARELPEARTDGWVRTVEPGSEAPVAPYRSRLERGELQAVATAISRDSSVLLRDEHAGRAVAGELDLRLTGTIGLLLQAKADGKIAKVRPVLDRLRTEAGFWVSDDLYHAVLETAGEL
jgi:predicted nucleic acid-binding protein